MNMKKITLKTVLICCSMLLSSGVWAQRFAPTVDTYIDQTAAQADKVQNSTNPHKLVVRKATNQERITFLEFNIGDYKDKAKKAELCMYMFNTNATNAVEEVEVYEVTSGNISNDITWNNFNENYTLSDAPISSLTITTGATVGGSYGWYRFDVTSLINSLVTTTGVDKKVKVALKAKTTSLLLNFYSQEANTGANNYPYYCPFLLLTPEISNYFIESSRETAVEDGYVYSVNADTKYDEQRLWINYYKSGDAVQRRIANLRFNIPSVSLTDAHKVTIKTKLYKDQSGEKPVYVVDLYGMPNLDASEVVNVNNLTWNTMPSNVSDYVYLRSYFSSVEDKDNEVDIEWDVTDYVKAQQIAGKTSAVFSLQVPELGLGGVGGHNIALYARNYLNINPNNVPQIILYEDESFVSIGETEADQNVKLIVKENTLWLSNAEDISGSIYSIQGALLQNIKEQTSIDISSYGSGLYLLKVANGGSYKFVKK